jgi:hypothetical protein
MLNKITGLSVVFLMVTGCATSGIVTAPTYEIAMSELPPTGIAATMELGETLVVTACSREADSWEISAFGVGEDDEPFSWSSKATVIKLPSQILKPLGQQAQGTPVFVATRGSQGRPPNRKPINPNGDLFNSFCEKGGELHMGCDSLVSSPFVEVAQKLGEGWARRAKYRDLNYPSLRQELIYNGRIGNDIRFVYRELATQSDGGAIMRSPFQQDVQYDLSESDVIGFKGARLRVIEASNTKITYEVFKHFPVDCSQQM